MSEIRVHVDRSLCTGHGRCYDLAPAVFAYDEDGYSEVISAGPLSGAEADDARRGADACPERAISIETIS